MTAMEESVPNYSLPPHVPADLVVDIDLYDIPGDDPQIAWRNFRTKGPLSFSPRNGGFWVATSGSAVMEFYRDFNRFSSSELVIPRIEGDEKMLPIQADPPDHAEYRKNIMGMFTSNSIDAQSAGIRDLCVDLIDRVKPNGSCDFVQAFSVPLPITIFLRMMGLPDEDLPYLRELVERFLGSSDPAEKGEAHEELYRYIDQWIDKREAEPGDDAITMLTRSKFHGRDYTREEVRSTISLLLHGGLDTVTNILSFIVKFLAENPDQANFIRGNLNDPKAMHQIVQELLRRFSVPNMARILAQDIEYEGIVLKKGDMIILPPSIYNMDGERIDDPDTVDFARSNVRHISFGSGPHTCAGALLAREEILVFLQEWLSRMPVCKLDPARPPRMQALPNNTVRELWLIWDSEAAA